MCTYRDRQDHLSVDMTQYLIVCTCTCSFVAQLVEHVTSVVKSQGSNLFAVYYSIGVLTPLFTMLLYSFLEEIFGQVVRKDKYHFHFSFSNENFGVSCIGAW